jgi:glucosamine--fructose-6-phosphate aminotransferase (isomerizing)
MIKLKIPFMAKEMMEQPALAKNILKKRWPGEKTVFTELKAIDLKRVNKVFFWGIGSSYHAAILASYYFESLTGLPGEYEQADEALVRKAVVETGAMVVVMSQSGETGDAVKAARYAKKQGALVLVMVNRGGSTLSKAADAVIELSAGKETAVPATKSFFAEGLMSLLLALYVRQYSGKSAASYKKSLTRLPGLSLKLLKADYELCLFAEHIARSGRAVFLGRGLVYPIALEGALKAKEAALINSEAYASEEYRHGPEALAAAGTPVLLIASGKDHEAADKRLARELLSRQVDLMIIGNIKGLEKKVATYKLPSVPDFLQPLLVVFLLQQLALAVGLAKGLDVDKPRNLKKFLK